MYERIEKSKENKSNGKQGFVDKKHEAIKFNQKMNPLNKSCPTVQRLEIKDGVLVSTFDKSKIINGTQSVISVRSSDKVFHGGHARIYLEYLNNQGEGIAQQLDLWADETGRIYIDLVMKQKEYNPSNFFTKALFNKSIGEEKDGNDRTPGKLVATGNYESYAIKANDMQKALIKIAEIKKKAESGDVKYGTTGNTISNLNPFATPKMNCAEFAAEVLRAAGVPVSSGFFGMPSTVSSKDTRTKDQIYKDAAKI